MIRPVYSKLREQGVRFYYTFLHPQVLKRRARVIGKKDKIEVVFFAMNLAMWRYQGVYDLLSKEDRFDCHIILTTPRSFSKEQQVSDLQQMRDYFGSQGIKYIDFDENEGVGYDVKEQINPDIVFYPQPYSYMYPWKHDFFLFKKNLICYIPYSINVIKVNHWLYDLPFHNMAWKIFCPLQIERDTAIRAARNHGVNWVVSGYYNLDKYLLPPKVDVWNQKAKGGKRLIWAPHFTITAEGTWLAPRSNFLWMAQLMLEVAEKYNDRLQIAFKPHPRLKSELYRHPDWGKERTDEYYQRWETMENTQLETGDFVDLFMTSDAMIHDCASFTAEYLFVNKPVAFVATDLEQVKPNHSEFGQMALDQHYIVGNEQEMMAFIEDVVLGGQDTMKSQRTEFFETVLKPNVTGNTSQFIVDDIKKGLGL